ncbi:MAG: response regulator [Phycisphaerales bacterium JB043]
MTQKQDNTPDTGPVIPQHRDPLVPRHEASVPPVFANQGRVLVVARDPHARSMLAELVSDDPMLSEFVSTFAQALDALTSPFDVVVAERHLPDGDTFELMRLLEAEHPHTSVILLDTDPAVDDALRAMRLGAVDLLTLPLNEEEVLASMHMALDRARRVRAQERETQRLRRVCRRLDASRREINDQIDSMCNDLVGAYQELADQVSSMSIASEFQAVIAQELDIEELLRKMLEFMLTRTGPTNAAVYMPSNHSDFSLGAYVNYDCPRDTADMLLEHLAGVIPAKYQESDQVHVFQTPAEMRDALGDDAAWIEDSSAIIFSCRHDDECLAVLTLFRDSSRPYTEDVIDQVRTMGSLFARQLAKVIRVHHRHTHSQEDYGWDEQGDYGDDYSDGYGGGGGLAA